MKPKIKTAREWHHGGFLNEINSTACQSNFGFFDYNERSESNQCRKCASDYMRFATSDGICIRCQQKCEYIICEHRQIIHKMKISKQIEVTK